MTVADPHPYQESHRAAASAAAVRAEEFRAAITETMVEGLYALDADGRLTFINGAASEMLGWSEMELRKRNVHDTIHSHRSDGTVCHADECGLARVRGEPVHSVDDTLTRRDGTTFPVTYSAAPLPHAEHGRELVVVFRDATQERSGQLRAQAELDALQWLGRTREAIDEDRLVLYSQPVLPLLGGKEGEELLLRMVGRAGEIISPARFMPVSEKYGLIVELDRWVVARAARLAVGGRRVHVKLSAKSIGAPMLDYIEHELRHSGATPSDVVFELTETALMADIAAADAFARGLNRVGCAVALDDFGTGFASLAHLKLLPIQYLRIDIEFVRDLLVNETNRHFVRAIVSLARAMDQTTIAAGVEDEETLSLLRECGVDFAQGYHIGRPAPIRRPAAVA